MRLLALLLPLLLLGCASSGGKSTASSGYSLFSGYQAALKQFEAGDIMEARATAQKIPAKSEDYAATQELLNKKIEPARKRLLRHYSRKAQAAEAARNWFEAMNLYEQAASFAPDDAQLTARNEEMQRRMRQLRLDALLERRRNEDRALLAAAGSFTPPAGLNAEDEVFAREARLRKEQIDELAAQAYDEAARYLRNNEAEAAWAAIESHLRLAPDSERGAALQEKIRAALFKGVTVAGESSAPLPSPIKRTRKASPEKISDNQVRAALARGELVLARQLASQYRREGGAGAGELLRTVIEQSEARAAERYQQGNVAFRQENLDLAVRCWREATQLAPDNDEYAKALMRAQQLQDRLKVLRSDDEKSGD